MIDTESECCAVNSKHVNMSYYHCDMTVMAVFALCYLGGRSLLGAQQDTTRETRPDVK